MVEQSLLEKYRQRQQDNARRSNTSDLWANIDDGDNFFRILRSAPDGGFYVEAAYHNNLKLLGVDADKGKGCYCRKSFDKKLKCPVCDLLEEMKKSEDPQEVKIAKDCKAKRKCVSWAFKLKSPQDVEPEDPTPRILTYGATVESQLLTYFLDPDYGDFTDPETGRNITITKTGKELNTEYSVRPRPKVSGFAFDPSNLASIESTIPPRSYTDMCEMLGQEPQEGYSEEHKPEPAKKTATPAAATLPKPVAKAATPPAKKATVPASKPKPAPAPEPEPEEPPVEGGEEEGGEEDTSKPSCFGDGETFNPRSDECKACPHMKPCKDIFLGIG